MNKNDFKLTLRDDVLRKMNRVEYYATSSYLRKLRRAVVKQLPPQSYFDDAFSDMAMQGYAINKMEAVR